MNTKRVANAIEHKLYGNSLQLLNAVLLISYDLFQGLKVFPAAL